jgi:hypothetical protein
MQRNTIKIPSTILTDHCISLISNTEKKNTGPRVVKLPEYQPSVNKEKRIEEPTIAKQKVTVSPFESTSCHYVSPSLLRSVKRWGGRVKNPKSCGSSNHRHFNRPA